MKEKNKITEIEEINLKNPIVLEGLPGIGFVGKFVVDQIIKKRDATKFAELKSDYFPPQVTMKENGLIEHMKNEFYYIKDFGDDNQDVILLTGNSQGSDFEGQTSISQVLMDYFEDLGATKIYTLGGLGTGEFVEKNRVFVAANNEEMIREVLEINNTEVRKEDGGAIIGASGLLLYYAEEKNIPGLCLMGETPGFFVDASAAKAVLLVLFELLNFEIELDEIDEQIEETKKRIAATQKLPPMGMEQPMQSPDDLRYIG
ncbi:MAG: proteasome assembly chaperone family protein [Methanosphaera sp. rholeuAM270]|nr:MAG: proteasome assembly chaperone family protein [Methanosphaera sp. rholeuAM270]